MSISVIYHAEVKVPYDVSLRFGHTREYEARSMHICRLVASSGQSSYSTTEEWGEDSDRANCEAFEAEWLAFIAELQAREPDPED